MSRVVTFTILSLSLATIMAAAAIAPAIGIIGDHFHTTDKFIVMQIISLQSLFIIFSSFLFAYLSKKLGSKDIAILGLVLYIIGGIGPFFCENIYTILLLRVVLGIGIGLIQPLSTGLIGLLYDNDEKSKLLGYTSGFTSLSAIILTPLSSILAAISWNYSFLVYLLGFVILLLVVLYLPKVNLRSKDYEGNATMRAFVEIYPYAIGVFLSMLTFYSFPTNFSIVMVSEQMVSTKYIGFLLAYQHIFSAISGIIFGRVVMRFKDKAKFFYAVLFVVGFYSQFIATNLVYVFIGLTFVGFAQGALVPTMFSLVSKNASKENMAVAMALMSAALYFGQFLNPFVVSVLSKLFGFESARGAFGVSFILAILLFVWMFYIDKFAKRIGAIN